MHRIECGFQVNESDVGLCSALEFIYLFDKVSYCEDVLCSGTVPAESGLLETSSVGESGSGKG